MARIYLSSTLEDLRAERQAAIDWLIAAGHQPVHSYRPDGEAVSASCLADIDGCDVLVLILGHRYGHVPVDDNPHGRSITQLEFERAGELGLPRVALLRTSVPDARLSDLTDPARAAQVLAFRADVARAVRVAEFSDLQGFVQGLSTGVPAALRNGTGDGMQAPAAHPGRPSHTTPPRPPTRQAAPATGLPRAALAIALLTGAALLGGWWWQGRQPADTTATNAPSTPPPTASPDESRPASTRTAVPAVAFNDGKELVFNRPFAATYTVMEATTRAARPGIAELRLVVRAFNRDRYDMNFWDRSFRLQVDGVLQAPVQTLNELVPGNSAKDGEVVFEVPTTARTLALVVIHHEGDNVRGSLPMSWTRP